MLKSKKWLKVISSFCALCMAASFLSLTPVSAASARKVGDVNGDGKVTLKDASMVQQHVTRTRVINDTATLRAADVNFDRKVTIADALLIQKVALELTQITPFVSTSFTYIGAGATKVFTLKSAFAASDVTDVRKENWLTYEFAKNKDGLVTGIKLTASRISGRALRKTTVTVNVEGNDYTLNIKQNPDGGFRSELSADEQFYYDKCVEHFYTKGRTNLLTISISSKNYPKSKEEKIKAQAATAVSAFLADYSELFWFTYQEPWVYESDGICSFIKIYAPRFFDPDDVKDEVYSGITPVVNMLKQYSTRYERVVAIHDYLVNNIEYGRSKVANAENTIAPAFCSQKYGDGMFCCGYAKTFKLLCDKLDIPAIYVEGDGSGFHAWNYVKMDDGKWYGVDVTWDDYFRLDKAYFLVGKNTIVQGSAFASSHIHNAQNYVPYVKLPYPELASDRYVPKN